MAHVRQANHASVASQMISARTATMNGELAGVGLMWDVKGSCSEA